MLTEHACHTGLDVPRKQVASQQSARVHGKLFGQKFGQPDAKQSVTDGRLFSQSGGKSRRKQSTTWPRCKSKSSATLKAHHRPEQEFQQGPAGTCSSLRYLGATERRMQKESDSESMSLP